MNKGKLSVWIMLLLSIACKTFQVNTSHSRDFAKKELVQKTIRNTPYYQTYSGKAKIDWNANGETTHFKVNFRIRKDSVIWASVTVSFGIEVGRVLLTPDSLKFLDKVHKVYYAKPFDYISFLAGTPVDFSSLEKLLAGQMIIDDPDRLELNKSNNYYILAGAWYDIGVHTFIDPASFMIRKIALRDDANNRFIDMVFDKYEPVENQNISLQRYVTIRGDQTVNLSIELSKVRFDQKLRYPFKVNQNYEKID